MLGAILDMVLRFWWLFVIGVNLIIAGIFVRPCLYIGIAILLIDVIISVIGQLRQRAVMMKNSDAYDFVEFQDTVSNSDNVVDGVKTFVEEKISEENDK